MSSLVLLSVTKETLRCNVIVGGVARLEIETTTRILYLEDSPEELVVRGFDSEGQYTIVGLGNCLVCENF